MMPKKKKSLWGRFKGLFSKKKTKTRAAKEPSVTLVHAKSKTSK